MVPAELEAALARAKIDLANANTKIRTLHADIEFPHISQKRLATVNAEIESLGVRFDALIAEQHYLETTLDKAKCEEALKTAYAERDAIKATYDKLAAQANESKKAEAVDTALAKAAPKLAKLEAMLEKLSTLAPETLEAFVAEATKLIPPSATE